MTVISFSAAELAVLYAFFGPIMFLGIVWVTIHLRAVGWRPEHFLLWDAFVTDHFWFYFGLSWSWIIIFCCFSTSFLRRRRCSIKVHCCSKPQDDKQKPLLVEIGGEERKEEDIVRPSFYPMRALIHNLDPFLAADWENRRLNEDFPLRHGVQVGYYVYRQAAAGMSALVPVGGPPVLPSNEPQEQ
jgi:hypothetical protein